jgi:hypothetical protein
MEPRLRSQLLKFRTDKPGTSGKIFGFVALTPAIALAAEPFG